MVAATFTSRGRGTGDPEEQFVDAPEEDIEDEDLPKVLEDADQPMEGKTGTSKSEGKTGETVAQATEEAEAPPEETPPDPNPTEPQPGTSTEPPKAPEEPTQDPTQVPGKAEIKLTQYVKDYRAAGKVWLDSVVEQKGQAYDTLYDKLQQLGSPHIVGLDQADKEQVFKCIRDRTGRFLTQDDFVLYIEIEEEIEKLRYRLIGKAKEALSDYYNAVNMLCEAQTNFAKSTQVLRRK